MEDNKIRIGITQGDINGVGYEVILKTFSDPMMLELCTPIDHLRLTESSGLSSQSVGYTDQFQHYQLCYRSGMQPFERGELHG